MQFKSITMIDLITQMAIMYKKRLLCIITNYVNEPWHIYAFDENFHGHSCPRQKAAKFCHPGVFKLFPILLTILVTFTFSRSRDGRLKTICVCVFKLLPILLTILITFTFTFSRFRDGRLATIHIGVFKLFPILFIILITFTFSRYRDGRLKTIRIGVFKLFPILLTILIVWGLCAILTATGAISEDNAARWVRKSMKAKM